MIEKLKSLVLAVSVVVGLGTVLAPAVHAQSPLFQGSKNQACQALNNTSGSDSNSTDCGNATTNTQRVLNLVKIALNILSFAIGIISVIMIVISGLKYVTSQGDSTAVNSAKNTLLYAVIGLVISLLAQVIVQFVLGKTTGTPKALGSVMQRQKLASVAQLWYK